MPEDGLTAQEKSDLEAVGKRIKWIRERRDMTQGDLSQEMTGRMSPKAISRYERGERQMRLTTFFEFAEGLKVTPNDISPERLLANSAAPLSEFSELTPANQDMFREFLSVMVRQQSAKATT